ncbi:nuclear transport factor 2 family protein [Aetokthonos hydrillicola Thurmond2011]|jgi:hypothetical protein|uniref:Nuclear transport factor 2 family protein n=1 Tax=Aetokthonos hydrillicola Thurmond2011 TaxID=2712845 RepID=A0AAP5I4C4_9CYAN|nr:nuclear transport factor 2 family protein [Aetokthonos hydrillicola]MBO3459407.1 nuclear transport factor 2 family protein [Aetokthonos hydrillicola CCALA 1050]MBW4586553.1 nuclear transport factor 2 family protein [Aetokthonos hydrillicola CCALA 1050]MDR9893502.1 nuclear transport factor 2 family protein [Aetokthonos hydrillicola Thurmond2011]
MNETQIKDFFKSVDGLNLDDILAPFTDDARLQFGNAPVAVGKNAIRSALKEFFSSIRTMHHEIIGVWTGYWEEGKVLSVELAITYILPNGTRLTVPCNSTIRLTSTQQIQDYRIFIDISPISTLQSTAICI